MFVASRSILSNFFEEKWPQNHPQCFSGLSCALFPTTFLEIAVCVNLRPNSKWPVTWLLEVRENYRKTWMLTPFRLRVEGGGGGWATPLAKKSNHCKTVQAKANELSDLSLNLTGNILKSSWRVRQYWFYHGNRVCILSKKLVLFLFLLIEFLYYP